MKTRTRPPRPSRSPRSERRSVLQEEIQQTRPFRSLSQEAVLGLFRSTDQLKREIAATIEPTGVTLQQYNVLRILRGAGEGGLPTLAVAERMVERTPGITRLIDKLAAKNLVSRERSPGDRRCVVCRVTPAGLELLGRLDPAVDAVDDVLESVLADAEIETLIELLDRLRRGLAGRDAEAP
ncbi:MAG: MarR family transcriptional regulator [Acidobacteriota bacterium]